MKPWARAAVQGAACGLVFGMVLLIGGWLWQAEVVATRAKSSAVPDVVRARCFEAVDAAGRVRAVLDAIIDIPKLVLFDAAGKERAGLALLLDGRPELVFQDAAEAQKVRASLHLGTDGMPWLVLRDPAGKLRAWLLLSEDGSPSLGLADKHGNLRAVVGSTKLETFKTADVTIRSESSFVLFDKDGKVIWKAP